MLPLRELRVDERVLVIARGGLEKEDQMSLDTLTGLDHAQEADEFPLLLYIYDQIGFYSGAKYLGNSEELRTAFEREVIPAIREGREVRICDGSDYLCFHAKQGHILYPPHSSAKASAGAVR